MPTLVPLQKRQPLLRVVARGAAWTLWVFLFVILIDYSTVVGAQTTLDDKHEIRVPTRAPLKWENFGDGLQHIAGPAPKFNRTYKLNVVELSPGEFVDFQVPQHEYIRVVSCGKAQISNDSLEIWTSNGTGLFRKLTPAIATNGYSMVAAPDDPAISIGRVQVSPTCAGPLTVAVFTSSRHKHRPLDYYQCEITCDSKRAEISDDTGGAPRYYTPLQSGRRYPLDLEGNTRLRLETRLKYNLDASQHQFYWVKIFVDGIYHKTLLFDTLPQRMNREFVDGVERLIGGREFEYMDIENDCESVEIELSHPAYIRADAVGLNLCNPLTNRRFNFPGFEKRLTDDDAWLDQEWLDDGKTLDQYLHGENLQVASPTDSKWDPYLNYSKLVQVARDNSVQHGGLRAYMWMRAMTARRQGESDFGDEVSAPELVNRLKSRFTYFRDFTPIEVTPAAAPRRIGFPVRAIRRPKQHETETIVGEQHIFEAASRLPTTTLYRLTTCGDESCGCGGLNFRPQQSLGRTMLRWVIDRRRVSSDAQIHVQYDDRPPITLRLQPTAALPPDAFIPGRSEAALASLSIAHNRYDSGPWGGPFASIDQTVPMIQAGTAEMILPAGVREVKVTATSSGDQGIDLGCQILVDAHVELSESAYLKHSRYAATTPELKTFSGEQLNNDSLDVQRLINSHIKTFGNGVLPGNQLAAAKELWSTKRLEEERTAALAAANVANWPTVMEHLTEMVHHSKSDQQRDAIVTRTELLEYAGEHFLANKERKGWLLNSKDKQLQRDLLKKLLAETDDRPDANFLREQILAVAASEIGDPAIEIQFATQLADNGRYRAALLSLNPEARGEEVEELRLRCCFQLRWWRSFKDSLKRVEDLERRNFWGGMKLLQLGKYKRAFKLLSAAGERGQTWLTHWKFGDHVYTRLTDADFLTRMSAIEDWERYIARTPGHRVKRSAPAVVQSCYGAATIYSVDRDIRYDFFMSLQSAPATIAIHGPIKIQIESRPLHNLQSADGINGVLEISNGSDLRQVPIINNRISSSLQIEGREDRQFAGTKIITEIDLPAGLNQINLVSHQTDLLHRVSTWQPEIFSPVLPPVNETTLAAVILGRLGNTHAPQLPPGYLGRIGTDTKVPDLVRLISREVGGRSLAHGYIEFDGTDLNLTELTPLLTEQMGDLPAWQNRITPSHPPLAITHQDEVLRQAISIAYALKMSDSNDPALSQNLRLQKMAELESLLQQHPHHRELQGLRKNIAKGASWKRIEQFDRRAGVYLQKLERWRPDTPAIRFRKSLQGNLSPQRAIVGSEPLILDLDSIFAPEVEVSLSLPRVGFQQTADTTVMWEVGGKQDQVTLKNHNQVETFRVKIEPQNNQIQLWMPQPYANHYVHVNVGEVLLDGKVDPNSDLAASLGSVTRSYHVATAGEPLRFRVAGPNVIRVDQLVDDRIHSKIVPVTEEVRTFELVPRDGEKVARYRIFEVDLANEASPVYQGTPKPLPTDRHWIDNTVTEVFQQVDEGFTTEDLDLLGLRSPDAGPVDVDLNDTSLLGLQESGTTGFHAGFRSRRALDEFPLGGVQDEFFELGLTNHYYDRWKDQYRRSEFLIRPRLGSGPTFGFKHSRFNNNRVVDDAPDSSADSWGPLSSQWNVYAFGQRAGTPLLPGANSFPWTAGLSGSLSRKYFFNPNFSHRPKLTFHGRFLSEDFNGFAPGELDQDIFTTYKRDHRYGLRFSDTYVWQHCLDQRWYFRPMLNGNEDQLIPDNAGFEIGADQLLGPVQLHVDYSLRGFFVDNDRSTAAVQNVLSLDLKTERWHSGGHRSEIDFSVRHAIDGGTSVGVFFNHYFNDGRGYRDFNPSSTLFRSLRQERATKINHFYPD